MINYSGPALPSFVNIPKQRPKERDGAARRGGGGSGGFDNKMSLVLSETNHRAQCVEHIAEIVIINGGKSEGRQGPKH